MTFRKLQIAFSAICGIACVFLIALLVRSYGSCDTVYIHGGHLITSLMGRLYFDEDIVIVHGRRKTWQRELFGYSVRGLTVHLGNIGLRGTGARLSVWPVIAAIALLAASPWMRWRFSLRTLLIGMTLIATLLWWGFHAATK